jgi:hypothetical protein
LLLSFPVAAAIVADEERPRRDPGERCKEERRGDI